MVMYFRKYEFTRRSFAWFAVIALGVFFVVYPGIVKFLPGLMDGDFNGRKSELFAWLPWIVIAGAAGLIISVLVVYFTFVPAITAQSITFALPGLLVSFGFYMILPIILYFLAIYLNKRRGVPIERRFREVPPD